MNQTTIFTCFANGTKDAFAVSTIGTGVKRRIAPIARGAKTQLVALSSHDYEALVRHIAEVGSEYTGVTTILTTSTKREYSIILLSPIDFETVHQIAGSMGIDLNIYDTTAYIYCTDQQQKEFSDAYEMAVKLRDAE